MLRRRGKFLKDILGSELKLQEGGAQKTRQVLEGHPGSELKLQEGGAQKTRQVLEGHPGLRTEVAGGRCSEDAASS